jgi:hypothetical protein
LNVTAAIGAFAGAEGVGPEGPGLDVSAGLVGTAADPEGAMAAEGAIESVGFVPAEATLPTAAVPDGDGVGDSPDVASRAPAAMIRITHATPRMADRLRQLVSFTESSPPVLKVRVTRYPLRG